MAPHLPQSDGDDRVVRPKVTPRQKFLVRALRYYHFRNQIRYSQARPTQIVLPRETTRLDCSGLVSACMDFARPHDPVNWYYQNTDTQIKMGSKTTISRALPGALCFYGDARDYDPSHVAIFLGKHADLARLVTVPKEVALEMAGEGDCVLSMGHYPMGIYPYDYREDFIGVRELLL